jgi:hypothetical protein
LPGYKNGELHVEGYHYLLKGAGVGIAEQVIDKRGILAVGLCALAIGNPGGLDYPFVSAQIVNQPDKPLVQNREFLV